MPTPPLQPTKPTAPTTRPGTRKPAARQPVKPPVKPPATGGVLGADRLERGTPATPATPPELKLNPADTLDADALEAAERAARYRASRAGATAAPPEVPAGPPVLPPADAVAAALKGEPARLGGGEISPTVAIRELEARGDRRAFDVGLGTLRFEVVAPAGADGAATLARMLPLVADVPIEIRRGIKRVDVTRPFEQGQAYTVELVAPDGVPTPIKVERTAVDGPRATYTVSDRHGKFELVTTEDQRDGWEVAQAFHLWAMIPPAMRRALQTIRIEDGANPTDREFAEKYKMPDFVSAASAANGSASFWHGTKYLEHDTFMHEFGHVLGQVYSTKNELVPDGWPEAVAADARGVTKYGDTNPTEDFAESFWIYLSLQRGQVPKIDDAPATPQAFAERWPQRARILDAIFTGAMRPAEK